MGLFERNDVDAIVALHLAYSPSLEAVEPLARTWLPIVILDTTMDPAPGKSVEINDQYTYITPTPWRLSISDGHGTLRFTSFLYEELRAIRRAVSRLGLTRDFVEDLFFRNGMRLLSRETGAISTGN